MKYLEMIKNKFRKIGNNKKFSCVRPEEYASRFYMFMNANIYEYIKDDDV